MQQDQGITFYSALESNLSFAAIRQGVLLKWRGRSCRKSRQSKLHCFIAPNWMQFASLYAPHLTVLLHFYKLQINAEGHILIHEFVQWDVAQIYKTKTLQK